MPGQNPYSSDETVWTADGRLVNCDSLQFMRDQLGDDVEIRKSGDLVVIDTINADTKARLDKMMSLAQLFERKPRTDIA